MSSSNIRDLTGKIDFNQPFAFGLPFSLHNDVGPTVPKGEETFHGFLEHLNFRYNS